MPDLLEQMKAAVAEPRPVNTQLLSAMKAAVKKPQAPFADIEPLDEPMAPPARTRERPTRDPEDDFRALTIQSTFDPPIRAAERIAKRTPPAERKAALDRVRQDVSDARPRADQPFAARMIEEAMLGGEDIREGLIRTISGEPARGLTNEQLAFRDAILATRDKESPLIREDAKWLERNALKASRMAPPMVAGIGAGALMGGPAGAVGGAVAAGAANRLTNAAFWYTQIYPGEVDAMIAAGVPREKAEKAAFWSATAQAGVESLIVNPFKLKGGAPGPVRQTIAKWVRKKVLSLGKNVSLETIEEGLQGAISEGVQEYAKGQPLDARKIIERGVEDMKEAFGPLVLMIGTGGAVHTAAQLPGAVDQAVQQAQEPEPIPVPENPDALRKFLQTPEGTAAIAQRDPQAAQDIADQAAVGPVTRRGPFKGLERSFEPSTIRKMNEEDRAEVGRQLRRALVDKPQVPTDVQAVEQLQERAAVVQEDRPDVDAMDRKQLLALAKEHRIVTGGLKTDAVRQRVRQSLGEQGVLAAEIPAGGKITKADADSITRTATAVSRSSSQPPKARNAFARFIDKVERVVFGAGEPPITFTQIADRLEGKGEVFAPLVRVLRHGLPGWIKVRDVSTFQSSDGRPGYANAGNKEIGWIFHGGKTAPESLIHELGHHIYDSLPPDVRAQLDEALGRYTLDELYSGKHESVRRAIDDYTMGRGYRKAAAHEIFAMAFEKWAAPIAKTSPRRGKRVYDSPADADALVANLLGAAQPGVPPTSPLTQKAEAARGELGTSLDALGSYLQGRTFANPIDPELLKLVGKVAASAVKAGTLTFADYVNQVANTVGSELARRIAPALEAEWHKQRKKNKKLDRPGDVAAIVGARPGRPDLAIPVKPEPARELARDQDMARQAAGQPQVVPIAQMRAEADAMLAQDREGTRARILAKGQQQEPLNRAETIAAQKIFQEEAAVALAAGDLAGVQRSMALMDAYRETRAETARSLGAAGRDPLMGPEERARQAIMEAVHTKAPGQSTEDAAKDAIDTRKKAKAAGVDLGEIDQIAKDPVATTQAINTIFDVSNNLQAWGAAKSILREWFVMSILSGPTTNIANITGMMGFGALEFGLQKPLEALVNSARRKGDALNLSDLPAVYAGILPGIVQGFSNGLRAWWTGTPALELRIQYAQGTFDPKSIVQRHVTKQQAPLGGPVRKGMRKISFHALLGWDEFFKTVFARMTVAGFAREIARTEGLSGEALANRISEQMTDYGSAAWEAALIEARRLAFQFRKKGSFTESVTKFRERHPDLYYLFPFLVTPSNILVTGIRKTPLGSTAYLYRQLKAWGNGGPYPEQTRHQVEQLIAWGLVLAVAQDDPDDPILTGSSEEIQRKTRYTAYRTRYPQSVNFSAIGRRWRGEPPPADNSQDIVASYRRLEPLATMGAMTIDMVNAFKRGGPGAVPRETFRSLVGALSTKSMLATFRDLRDMVDPDRAPDAFWRWAAKFGASFIPNLIRSSGRAVQQDIPERRIWGENDDWWRKLGKRTIQQLEIGEVFFDNQPKIDFWGRAVKRDWESPGIQDKPQTDLIPRLLKIAYRATMPIPVRIIETAPGDRVIVNWNNANPGKEWFPQAPRPGAIEERFGTKDERMSLTDMQIRQFLELSGQAADLLIRRSTVNTVEPGARDLKMTKTAITKGRAYAEMALRRAWAKDPASAKDEGLAQSLLDEVRKTSP